MTISLWPGLAPNETSTHLGDLSLDASGRYGPYAMLSNITQPEMIFYPASGPQEARPTLLVLPGGGYHLVTTNIEGSEVAHWLNGLGYHAAVLHYRVPDASVPDPARRVPALQDAQRAMSLLRAQAKPWEVDPRHVGIIGFSAGGHLAACLAAGHEPRAYPVTDTSDQADFRPDFALLIYPAYLWDKGAGTAAPEVQPQAGMPPLFLMQTRDDHLPAVDGYAAEAERAGIETKSLIYDAGGHGYGLRLSDTLPAHRWSEEASEWIKRQIAP